MTLSILPRACYIVGSALTMSGQPLEGRYATKDLSRYIWVRNSK